MFSILLIFSNTLLFPQNIKSIVTINTYEDETIESGMELQPNKYLFITRHGIFSDILSMNWWEIFGYNSRLYVTDSNLKIQDSIDLLIPDYYTIAYKIQNIRDTIVILGRAIKTDLSEEHIFFASFTKDLVIIQIGTLGIQGNYELFNDADTNANGEIVITAMSNNYANDRHNLFLVTNNKKELISYISDSTSVGYARIHYNISSDTYHLIGSKSVSFYDSNFSKINEKGFPFNGHFFYQYYVMPVNDYSYALQGIGFFKLKNRNSGLDISYYLVDTGVNVLDSNYIYFPDSLDNAGGLDFKTTDSIFMGGTFNTNWGGMQPPQFQHENHHLVVQCSNLYTNEIYWTKVFADNGNYFMKNLFVTSDNQCVVMSTLFDWQNNPVQERDIVLFKLDGNGNVLNIAPKDYYKSIYVFPIPGNKYINIKIDSTCKNILFFRLYDQYGKLIISRKILKTLTKIDVFNLRSGVYFFTIIDDKSNEIINGKWIKS